MLFDPIHPPAHLNALCPRRRHRIHNRTRLRNRTTDRPRNRRTRRPLCNQARASRRDTTITQPKRNMDAAGQTERNIELGRALVHGEFNGAGGIVECVRGHGVVVCVFGTVGWEGSAWCCGETRKTREEADVHCNIEEHAICLSVAEALAFGICFAERAAGCEGVLRAAGFEVVCWRALYVGYDTAAGSGCRGSRGC